MPHPQRFRVEVDGHAHEVEVVLDAEGHAERVTVDGRPCDVRSGPDGAAIVTGADGRTQHAVWLEPGPRPRSAATRGRVHALEIRSAREAALQDALVAAGDAAGGGSLVAPMPGRVVRVLLEVGGSVEAEQSVVIVEAMKMENEVRTPIAGTVARISVAAGETVEAGQLLAEIDPHPTSA